MPRKICCQTPAGSVHSLMSRCPYQQPHWATTLVLPLVAGEKAGYYPRVVELHFHLLLWCFLRDNYPSSRVVAATTLVAHQQLP